MFKVPAPKHFVRLNQTSGYLGVCGSSRAKLICTRYPEHGSQHRVIIITRANSAPNVPSTCFIGKIFSPAVYFKSAMFTAMRIEAQKNHE